MPLDEITKKLNTEQKRAAIHEKGPLLIVAGAGTGKTTILVNRLQYLFEKKLAKPDEILLVTFTEKAASEIEDRALKLLPYGYFNLWINTFHGFCEKILREHALDIGISSNFKLLNQTEQWILIKKNLDQFDLNYYKPVGTPVKFIEELVKHFSRLKDENIGTKEYLDYAEKLKIDTDSTNLKDKIFSSQGEMTEIARINELANAYHVYNRILRENAYLDFGDLITETIRLFEERPNVLEFYRQKFQYIMVDEFQDTNWAQYALIKILALPKNNLMVVGDDDQSIYKFRGASLSNIMQFKDDYQDAQEIVLTKNYRSGQEILDVAYKFIKHNDPNRLEAKLKIDKQLYSQVDEKGKVDCFSFENEEGEISWLSNKIVEIKEKEKCQWSDFVILTRSNNSAEIFLDELRKKNIPRIFYSSRGLYYKPIIMNVMAYFRLLDNYHESSALFRVLNMTEFKIEHPEIIALNKYAKKKVWSLFEALKNINIISGISEESKNRINKLLTIIERHSVIAKNERPSKVYVAFVRDSGVLKEKDFDRDYEFFSILNQFYKKIKSFEELENDPRIKDFVDLMNMEMTAGETGTLTLNLEDDDVVKIMTVHAAKGLEFDYVFLPGLVDKRFPTISRKEKIAIPDEMVREKLPEEKEIHIEEERRLFYVAITRAKKNLFLSSAKNCGGVTMKKPSLFIEESGLEQVHVATEKKNSDFFNDLNPTNIEKKANVENFTLPSRLSFSQLEAFNNCPLQYKFNFILHIPVLAKSNFIFGRVMHNTLREFLSVLAQGVEKQGSLFGEVSQNKKNPTWSDLQKIYEKQWQDDGYESKQEREEYYKKGKESLKIFYANLEKNGWPSVVFLEKMFTMVLHGYYFKGTIDRVDKLDNGTYEVIDYKTGKPKEKLEYNNKKQLLLYKIALEDGLGIKISKLSFYFLENGEMVSFESTDKLEEKFKKDILDTISEMKKGEFKANPGPLCSYCDFSDICEFRKV